MHKWWLALLVPSLWAACQPIVIGVPADEVPGNAAAGAGGSAAASSLAGSAGAVGTADAHGGGPSLGGGGAAAMGGQDRAGVAGASQGGAGEGGLAVQSTGGSAGEAPGHGGAGEGGAVSGCDLRITGHVASLRAHPVVGVTLELSGFAEATTTTDASGGYEFSKLCPGTYQLAPVCLADSLTFDLGNDRVQDFAGTPGSCDTAALEPRVLLVIFDPTASEKDGLARRLSTTLGVAEPDRTAYELTDALIALSNGHLQPVGTSVITRLEFPLLQDGYQYTKEEYAACRANPSSCHAEVKADYLAILRDNAICQRVADENVDEIWLMGGPHFGFASRQPLECLVYPDGVETMKKLDIVGLHYERELAGYLADYQARSQEALVQAFGPPPGTLDNPYGWLAQVAGHTPGVAASGCGDLNFPPNTSELNRFDALGTQPSFCEAFAQYPLLASPLAQAVPTNCTAWGCDELGYRRYWFSHLPHGLWLDPQGKLNDFWRYVTRPAERLDPAASTLTCSSSYMPGWCQHLQDGKHGKCNEGEWAMSHQTTGFVELLFRPKTFVSGVTLFDRGCDEQVLAGHLEFSDGSANVPFGELEQLGADATELTFPPKLLSGLRVVIDKSTGVNPGLGELRITAP